MIEKASKKYLYIGAIAILIAGILLGVLILGQDNNLDPLSQTSSQSAKTSGSNTSLTTTTIITSTGATQSTNPVSTGSSNAVTEGKLPTNPGPIMNPNDVIEDDPDVGIQTPTVGKNE